MPVGIVVLRIAADPAILRSALQLLSPSSYCYSGRPAGEERRPTSQSGRVATDNNLSHSQPLHPVIGQRLFNLSVLSAGTALSPHTELPVIRIPSASHRHPGGPVLPLSSPSTPSRHVSSISSVVPARPAAPHPAQVPAAARPPPPAQRQRRLSLLLPLRPLPQGPGLPLLPQPHESRRLHPVCSCPPLVPCSPSLTVPAGFCEALVAATTASSRTRRSRKRHQCVSISCAAFAAATPVPIATSMWAARPAFVSASLSSDNATRRT